jgi:hypothetical protein
MNRLINKFLPVMLLLPCLASAATDCSFVEYAEHYEAVCVGEPNSAPVPVQATEAAKAETARVPAVGSQRRPQTADLDSARAARGRSINEQRLKEQEGLESELLH